MDEAAVALALVEQPNSLAAEASRQMWCAVIALALSDALDSVRGVKAKDSSVTQWRREALAWIRNGGQNFHDVCLMAGLEPVAVRERALRQIAEATP